MHFSLAKILFQLEGDLCGEQLNRKWCVPAKCVSVRSEKFICSPGKAQNMIEITPSRLCTSATMTMTTTVDRIHATKMN